MRRSAVARVERRRHVCAITPDGMAEWRMRSNASEEQEDDNDEKDHSEAAGWGVAPALTVGPAREGSEESQDQDHDQDSSKHGVLLNVCVPAKSTLLALPGCW